MTPLFDSLARWLADYYLLSSALLFLAVLSLLAVKQPANRRAMTQSTLIALIMLAALCAIPGWSLLNLTAAPRPAAISESARTLPNDPNPFSATTNSSDPISPVVIDTSPALNAHHPAVPPIVPAPFTKTPWTSVAVFAWITGAAATLAWLAIGMYAANGLLRDAQPAPPVFLVMLQDLERESHRRPAKLLTSSRIDVAVALGVWHPAVLLPADWLRTQSPDDLRTVLAHEAAHVRNHDLQWLAVSRVLTVLLWANPLFWLLRRRIRLDQEVLADAAAAELTSRERYAERLVALAHIAATRPTTHLVSAVGLWEGPSQLRRRVSMLLDERFTVLRSCTRQWRIAAVLVAFVSALALSTLTFQPAGRAEAQSQATANEQLTPTADAVAPAADDVKSRPRPNTIAGRVVDENGQSLARIEVFLFRLRYADSTRKLISQQATDADGRFKFDNVIDISKEFPDGKFRSGNPNREEFMQIILRSEGKVTEQRLYERSIVAQWGRVERVTVKPAATLRGQITSPNGKPVEGALVSFGTLSPALWEGAMSARTDDDGNYQIDDIAPFELQQYREQIAEQRRRLEKESREAKGMYDALFISPPGLRVEYPDFAVKRVSVEQIPGRADVRLEPAAVLEGRVVFGPSGDPAVDARVEANTSHTNKRQVPPEQMPPTHKAVVRTDENGNYRFTTLPADTYDLSADLPGWVNVGVNNITVEAEKMTTAPDLTLSKGGVISVRLVDSKIKKPIDIPADTAAAIAAHQLPLQRLSRPVFEPFVPSNAEKRFELRTPPGTRLVWVGGVHVGRDRRWLGVTQFVGEPSIEVDVVEGQTVDVDMPVVDVSDASKAGLAVTGTVAIAPRNNIRQKPREAIESLSRTLKVQPDNVHALLDRALAFEIVGELGKAVADYEKVIELKPDGIGNLIAHNNLAYLLSTAPDDSIRNGKRAVELAKRAQQRSAEPSADILDTLAAAYAEAGNFEEAVKTQQQAIEMKPESAKFREHLELYQAKKPLRQTPP
jgi:beta-lactamase regulating signal transducer with metallopeptidase domain/protocatechuate 3,4-dioxygenase beta subunit